MGWLHASQRTYIQFQWSFFLALVTAMCLKQFYNFSFRLSHFIHFVLFLFFQRPTVPAKYCDRKMKRINKRCSERMNSLSEGNERTNRQIQIFAFEYREWKKTEPTTKYTSIKSEPHQANIVRCLLNMNRLLLCMFNF